MAQFVAANDQVMVRRETIYGIVESPETGRAYRRTAMMANKVNLDDPNIQWFNLQDGLNGFREISEKQGAMNLFMMGKATVEAAQFPPMEDLEEALQSLDIAYHMNHQLKGKVMFNASNGTMLEGIGHYFLKSFDEYERKAVMVCSNPYPCKFDQGVITQLVRKFKPLGARERVELDARKGSRLDGGDSCTFLISW